MAFDKKTIKDITLDGKTVLVRADYNVPLDKGKITSDYRIKQSLPTLKYLLDRKCRVVIMSHLGRPEGKVNPEFSLKPVAADLAKLLKRDVLFAEDCLGDKTAKQVAALKPGEVLLLENVRFYPEEEANDAAFAKKLAAYGEIFVQDCFGVAHRAHASVAGIAKYLPSVAGLLLAAEVDTITKMIQEPARPLMAIIGGAKIADKIDVIKTFIKKADFVAVGGAMANTFLLAEGVAIGKSLADKDDLPLAHDILELAHAEAKKRNFVFYLPQDSVVATKIDTMTTTRIVDWSAHVIASIENYPRQAPPRSGEVGKDELILDIGPFSGAFIAGAIEFCGSVIWNGTMGVTETAGTQGPVGPFAHGTELIVEAMLGQFGHKPQTLVGGGDTAAYIEQHKLTEGFDFVSTGGGACLELMAGAKLPGVEALEDKNGTIKHKGNNRK